jgi:nitroimidazol reductase NimA-like FMN-containing flavoprotein (pyridoxamine 5'-phosphate oxidase superfamily)
VTRTRRTPAEASPAGRAADSAAGLADGAAARADSAAGLADGAAARAGGPERTLSPTERTRHRRLRAQGRSERAELFAVLRAGLIAHLGVIIDGTPMVVPTVYGFDERQLYVHGSVASQSLAADDSLACVTVTLVDGLVLARSVFEHAFNYRSAMIYARPRTVTDPQEKLAGLRCVSEHLVPGQWDYVRQPSRRELAATRLLAMSLDEASVKIRTGPPDDGDSPDAALGLWAGELPLCSRWHELLPDPALPGPVAAPAHLRAMAGRIACPVPSARG